jgi:tetratricopeptide (TPR) repeat protein
LVRGVAGGYVEAVVECNLSQISARLGQHRNALGHTRRELALRQECGDPVGEAYALHDMAVAEQGLGNHHAAIALGERARARYRDTAATEQFLADVLETMAISLDHIGDHGSAGQCLREAATIRTMRGDARTQLLLERESDGSTPAVAGDVSA